MITLPSKFADENKKAENAPAFMVRLEDSIVFNEQTASTDWQANTGASNVDFVTSIGDVMLESLPIPNNYASNAWSTLHSKSSLGVILADSQDWQSFKRVQTPGMVKTLTTIKAYFRRSSGGASASVNIQCQVWTPGKGASLGTVTISSYALNQTGEWLTFDFTSQNISLSDNTEYWLRWTASYATGFGNIEQAYQNTNVYANGQFDRTGTSPGTNLGDLTFEATYTGIVDNAYYLAQGYIRTRAMDIGQTPTDPGEWSFSDVVPTYTALVYEAWASDSGAFSGEEVSLGVIQDGYAISTLKRYYMVKASFAATNDAYTPVLQSIKAAFPLYKTFSDRPGLGYEPVVLGVTSLSATIDAFQPSTISQITLRLGLTQAVSNWLATRHPKNKLVKILAGFEASGFIEADYIDYFQGLVESWSIDANDAVLLQVRDFKKEWSASVPDKWQSSSDDAVWTAQHPIDVMLDILRNRVNVRDSKIDTASFDTVKTALPGWKVSRTISGNPEDAAALLEELRVLASCFFIPQPDGRIKIKRWDASEAASDALIDDNTFGLSYDGNGGSLINRTSIYFNWDGVGDDAKNYLSLDIGVDAASQADWGEIKTKEIKDKWTRTADSAQIAALRDAILNRFANPRPVVSLQTDRSKIYLELGDVVTLTTKRAPSTDLSGVTDMRFQIIGRNLDFMKDVISFKLLAV